MPRARISKSGPVIAKRGYDVDTAAIENMAFDPRFIAARVFRQIDLAVAPFSGFMSDQYDMASYSYGMTFAVPPIVLVAGHYGTRRQVSAYVGNSIPLAPGTAYRVPNYEIKGSTTGFELYVSRRAPSGVSWDDPAFGGPPIPTTWRCTILQNSMLA